MDVIPATATGSINNINVQTTINVNFTRRLRIVFSGINTGPGRLLMPLGIQRDAQVVAGKL